MYIGIDAHKLSESVCVTDRDGTILEEYRMDNTEETWKRFMKKYRMEDELRSAIRYRRSPGMEITVNAH